MTKKKRVDVSSGTNNITKADSCAAQIRNDEWPE